MATINTTRPGVGLTAPATITTWISLSTSGGLKLYNKEILMLHRRTRPEVYTKSGLLLRRYQLTDEEARSATGA